VIIIRVKSAHSTPRGYFSRQRGFEENIDNASEFHDVYAAQATAAHLLEAFPTLTFEVLTVETAHTYTRREIR
jgi:hypothetical protein